jgi:hypothetical protein
VGAAHCVLGLLAPVQTFLAAILTLKMQSKSTVWACFWLYILHKIELLTDVVITGGEGMCWRLSQQIP